VRVGPRRRVCPCLRHRRGDACKVCPELLSTVSGCSGFVLRAHRRARTLIRVAAIGFVDRSSDAPSTRRVDARAGCRGEHPGDVPALPRPSLPGLRHGDGIVITIPPDRTSNLDWLGRLGTTFTSAYGQAPICTLGRASFVTGNTSRCTGGEHGRDETVPRGYAILRDDRAHGRPVHAGLASSARARDGAPNVMFILLTTSGSRSSAASCRHPHADLRSAGGRRPALP